MAIESFDELLRALREHPEWRDEMRRAVLTDELLGLPQTVERLADAQARTEARVEALAQALDELTRQVAALTEQVRGLAGDVAWLKGDGIERRYREYADAYFGPIARRLHTLTRRELDDLLESALERGVLTADESQQIRFADAVVRGRREGEEIYLVVESSWGVGLDDVQRARDRALLLARSGVRAIPVVAGAWATPDAQRAAPELEVWTVTDGRVMPPSGTAA